jgi:hypothetical protein
VFLYDYDVPLPRVDEAAKFCGLNPRQTLRAAISKNELGSAEETAKSGIKNITDVHKTIADMYGDPESHRIFEIYPRLTNRNWESCRIRPISKWVWEAMLAAMNDQSLKTVSRLYKAIKGMPYAASFTGYLWEYKVHKYFRALATPKIFLITSLHDRSTLPITFSPNFTKADFGASQDFQGSLTTSVVNRQSSYLQPQSPIYPSFDSFYYQHGLSEPGCGDLICFHITVAEDHHPISVKGLELIQRSLTPNTPLQGLRPLQDKKLIIVFVVPEPEVKSFRQQHIKDGASIWASKTEQFVLGLPENLVIES